MNCRNCGAPVKDGAKFCAGCGQTIKEPSPAPVQQAYSQPVQQNPFQQNQYQPQPQNQQMYGGGYAQNQQNYGYQGQQGGYGGEYIQQGGFGGYIAPPSDKSIPSGIKTILLLFMAAAIILSSLGMLYFPFVKSADDDLHYSSTNGAELNAFMTMFEYNDGDLGETLEKMFEDEDALMVNIGFIASVVLLGITVLFCIIGLICGLAGSHSASAAIMGIGSLITAVGYLFVFIEGISGASNTDDSIMEFSVSLAPLIMIFVSAAMFILACVSAGKMRNS